MKLTVTEIAKILGTYCGAGDRTAEGYSIDSRTIKPGDLFFAIKGPRFDGHEFVAGAIEKGAAACVVIESFAREASQKLRPFLLPVPDTLLALQNLAQAVRRKWGGRVVAVTGSTGKTTTKELIAALLSTKFSVLKSQGNLNNLFGLPLTLLGLEESHEVAVVELAMSAKGEIARLAQIAEPDVGVVTNVAPVHLEFFDSMEGIAAAKRELIENLSRRREVPVAILNFDDARVRKFAESFNGRVVTFGFSEGADVRGEGYRPEPLGNSRFRVSSKEMAGEFFLPLPGRHNVENALAAIATASVFQISPNEVREGLAKFRSLSQRSEILTLPNGVTLLNDSYNSNPRAMEAMLVTLAAWGGARRRILVAGEMLELGSTSPELHRQVGAKAAASHVDWLIAVQGDAREFIVGALAAGFPQDRTRFIESAMAAGEFCRGLLASGDVVLIKGSRGVHLETVTKLLLEWPGNQHVQGMPKPGGKTA
jgi:UDP-N-acetylmuramoyl-tripeptide--D-alanyl-D-alanine ligase